jgi:hypothetical protein
MDDHTFFLVRDAEERLRRTEVLIEQHRLHIATLHPSRRAHEVLRLKSLIGDYDRLRSYRHALTAKPSRALMN